MMIDRTVTPGAQAHYTISFQLWRESRHKGRDLKNMGLEPGPIYREVLQAVLDARLDGKLKTEDDEIEYARRYIQTQ